MSVGPITHVGRVDQRDESATGALRMETLDDGAHLASSISSEVASADTHGQITVESSSSPGNCDRA